MSDNNEVETVGTSEVVEANVVLNEIPIHTPERAGGNEIYSNHVTINWTPYDVRMRFGQVVASQKTRQAQPTFAVEERVNVTLSWLEAKQCRDLLNEVIVKMEKRNGEITAPQFPI